MARPLSTIAHAKVLDAASELIADRGIESASMDAIARRSGVSKATIYNHWADKEALVLEILGHVNGINGRPEFNSGDTRQDLVAVLSYRPPDDPVLRERITPHLVAYSATRPEFGMVWRNTILDPPRRELRQILQRAIDNGELSAPLDFDIAIALLLGPMMYWFVFRGKSHERPVDLAEHVADAFLKAFTVRARE